MGEDGVMEVTAQLDLDQVGSARACMYQQYPSSKLFA